MGWMWSFDGEHADGIACVETIVRGTAGGSDLADEADSLIHGLWILIVPAVLVTGHDGQRTHQS